jgi:hypothetical protein
MDKLPRMKKDVHLSEGDKIHIDKLSRMRKYVHLSEGIDNGPLKRRSA